jgi:hypothetical protein
MRIQFNQSGQVTWVDRFGRETRRFVSTGKEIDGVEVETTEFGLEIWDGGSSALFDPGVITILDSTPAPEAKVPAEHR